MNMFRDLLAALTTPLSPPLRSLGYLDEALSMRRRARISRSAWQPHLDRTRKFVLAAAERCKGRGRVIVLGSGLLLDVPLAELAGMFRQVVLRDVVCLPEIRKQIDKYSNARFEEHDVTGLAERLHQSRKQGLLRLPDIGLPAGESDADLVVSLNILSQLWVVPRAFIGQHMRGLDHAQVDDWCAKIVEVHYAWLRTLSCDVCLVGDYAYVKKVRDGSVVSRGSTIYDLPLPGPAETWAWNIAPIGRENPHTSKELIVGAWAFQPGTGRKEGRT